MKKWYICNWIEVIEDGKTFFKPDFGISLYGGKSVFDLGDGTCLVKVSAPKDQHALITATSKTDAEAEILLNGVLLSDIDAKDVESEILCAFNGFDSHDARVGAGEEPQKQEIATMNVVSNYEGVSISDLESNIKIGNTTEHSKAIDRLKYTVDKFTATQDQTIFNLSKTINITNEAFIYVRKNGLLKRLGASYDCVFGAGNNSIVFNYGLNANEIVKIKYLGVVS